MSRDPQINVRLPTDLKDSVQKMAEDNKRSVNAEIVAVLLEAVKLHTAKNNSEGAKLHEGDLHALREIISIQAGLLSDYRDAILHGTEVLNEVKNKLQKPT